MGYILVERLALRVRGLLHVENLALRVRASKCRRPGPAGEDFYVFVENLALWAMGFYM